MFVRGFAPTTMVQKAGTGPCRYGRRMRNGHKECETEIRFKTPVMTRGKSRHDSNQLRISGLGGTTVIVSMLDSGVWTLSLSLHLPAPISCRAIIAGVQSRRDFEKHSRKKKANFGVCDRGSSWSTKTAFAPHVVGGSRRAATSLFLASYSCKLPPQCTTCILNLKLDASSFSCLCQQCVFCGGGEGPRGRVCTRIASPGCPRRGQHFHPLCLAVGICTVTPRLSS